MAKGCRETIVIDGNMKNYRNVCFTTGIVKVSQESQDTQTREVELCYPGMILRSSEYPRNPRILKKGRYIELCPSRDYPRIVGAFQESQDSQIREVELCPSRDDPWIVRVSQESHDTQTREVELCHPGMILVSSEYPRNPRLFKKGR